MGLLENCKLYFATDDLYGVLGVSRNASVAELKKAYKKVSLLCHPDRRPEDEKENATKKFQTLSKVHYILTDQEKRTVYDETGCIDDENSGLEDKDWQNYWRLLFPKVTTKDIDNFMKKYKGSKEELEDLKKCYIKHKGDMNHISETFIGYDVNEDDNLKEILRGLIKKKEIPDFPKFTKETAAKKNARVKKYKKEAAEAGKLKADMDNSLVNALMQRSQIRKRDFDDMIKNIEAKYCKSSRKKQKKCNIKNAPEPEDENPQNDRQRMREADEMDNAIINAILECSAKREMQFVNMMKNIEFKYCKKQKK